MDKLAVQRLALMAHQQWGWELNSLLHLPDGVLETMIERQLAQDAEDAQQHTELEDDDNTPVHPYGTEPPSSPSNTQPVERSQDQTTLAQTIADTKNETVVVSAETTLSMLRQTESMRNHVRLFDQLVQVLQESTLFTEEDVAIFARGKERAQELWTQRTNAVGRELQAWVQRRQEILEEFLKQHDPFMDQQTFDEFRNRQESLRSMVGGGAVAVRV